jgi:hypothetical protein
MNIRSLLPLLLIAAATFVRADKQEASSADSAKSTDEAVPFVAGSIPAGYKLLFIEHFNKNPDRPVINLGDKLPPNPGALSNFVFTDPAAWKVSQGEDSRNALELTQQSKYNPPFRSPINIALITNRVFDDFIVEAECLQTGKEYGHRDMVFVYGYQSPSKYYYTHIATAADDHAHNCFIVNDAARAKFAKETTKGVDWGLNVWHKVRLERKASDGTIRVFFDDMAKPIMTAEDKTFGPGFIGFGSFDDTGKIANIRVWGKSVETRDTPAFAK